MFTLLSHLQFPLAFKCKFKKSRLVVLVFGPELLPLINHLQQLLSAGLGFFMFFFFFFKKPVLNPSLACRRGSVGVAVGWQERR